MSRNSKTRKLDTCKEEACNCPSGRLVIIDNTTGKTIEPEVKVQN
ncbi:hypothetical protein [Methanosarcina spelaei]|nr:hypothetical protein [Methanosarcina spelaei]